MALIVDLISQGRNYVMAGVVRPLCRNLVSLAKLIILNNHVRSHLGSSFDVSKQYDPGGGIN